MKTELASLRKEMKRLEEKTKLQNICPSCGKPILPEFKICPYCGEKAKPQLTPLIDMKDYK